MTFFVAVYPFLCCPGRVYRYLMNIQFCKPVLIDGGLEGAQKNTPDAASILRTIASVAVGTGAVPIDASSVLQRLQEREKIASTAIGKGVAIPHCMVAGITTPLVGLARAPRPLPFNDPGGEAVDLFFFILSPPDARTVHLQVLAAISRAVRREEFRRALREAPSAEALAALMQEEIVLPRQTGNEEPCRFRIHLQDAGLVEAVIEDLSAFGAGSIVVYECEGASSWLGNVPLFAGLWTSRDDTRIRVVEGIVQKARANELVRRVVDRTENRPGVSVTVEELLVAQGALEL